MQVLNVDFNSADCIFVAYSNSLVYQFSRVTLTQYTNLVYRHIGSELGFSLVSTLRNIVYVDIGTLKLLFTYSLNNIVKWSAETGQTSPT